MAQIENIPALEQRLWSDKTGLPDTFAPEEIEEKTEIIFAHVLMGARGSGGYWEGRPNG